MKLDREKMRKDVGTKLDRNKMRSDLYGDVPNMGDDFYKSIPYADKNNDYSPSRIHTFATDKFEEFETEGNNRAIEFAKQNPDKDKIGEKYIETKTDVNNPSSFAEKKGYKDLYFGMNYAEASKGYHPDAVAKVRNEKSAELRAEGKDELADIVEDAYNYAISPMYAASVNVEKELEKVRKELEDAENQRKDLGTFMDSVLYHLAGPLASKELKTKAMNYESGSAAIINGDSKISDLEYKIYQLEALKNHYNIAYDVASKSDFEEKSKGPSKELWEKAISQANTSDLSNAESDVLNLLKGGAFADTVLGYTEQEKSVIYYLANTTGTEAAVKYAEDIKGFIDSRAAQEFYKKYGDNAFVGAMSNFGAAFLNGRESFSGVAASVGVGDKDYYAPSRATLIADEFYKNAEGTEKTVYGAARGIGQMAPSLALSALGAPAVGQAVFAAGIYSDSYKQAVNSGANKFEAIGYGIVNAGMELALEKYLGAIPGFGKNAVQRGTAAIGRSVGDLKILNAFKSSFDDVLKSSPRLRAALSIAGKYAGAGISEYGEEYLSGVISPMWDNIFLGTNKEINVFSRENHEEGIIGAVVGLILNAPYSARQASRVVSSEYGANRVLIENASETDLMTELLANNPNFFKGVSKKLQGKLIEEYRGQKLHELNIEVAITDALHGAENALAIEEIKKSLEKKGINLSDYEGFINRAYELGKSKDTNVAVPNEITRLISNGESTSYIADKLTEIDSSLSRQDAIKLIEQAKNQALAESINASSMTDFEKANEIKKYAIKEKNLEMMYEMGRQGLEFDESMITDVLSTVEAQTAYFRGENARRAEIKSQEASNYDIVEYGDEETKNRVKNETHDAMVNEGRIVDISSDDISKFDEYFPDLRNVKKKERTPVLKGLNKKLVNYIENLLHKTFDNQKIEFEIKDGVIEAKLYTTGIEHVLKKVSKNKAAMLEKSLDIFKNSKYMYTTFHDQHNSTKLDVKYWHYFYVPVKYANEGITGVRIAVREMYPAGSNKGDKFQIYDWHYDNSQKEKSNLGLSATPANGPLSGDSSVALNNSIYNKTKNVKSENEGPSDFEERAYSSEEGTEAIPDTGEKGVSIYKRLLPKVLEAASEKSGKSVTEIKADVQKIFAKIYNAGKKGLDFEKSFSGRYFTESEARAIYEAGLIDAAAENGILYITDAHVIQDKVFKSMKLSPKTFQKLLALAKITGMNIRFSTELKQNAEFNAAKGEIIISTKCKNPVMVAALHEVVHVIRKATPADYNNLSQAVLSVLKKKGSLYQKVLKEYMNVYYPDLVDENGKWLDSWDEYTNEEIVADLVSMLLSDSDTVRKLGAKEAKGLARVIEALKALREKIIAKLRGMDNLDTSDLQKLALKSLSNDIEKIENAFATALMNTASVTAQRTEIKTSNEVKTEADERVPAVRHSISKNFKSQLDAWDGKTIGFSFVLGTTSDALKQAKVPDKQIRWDASKIKTLLNKHNGMSIETIKQIPELLENPIVVIDSKQDVNSRIVMGDLHDDNGKLVTVVLLLTPTSKKGNQLDIIKVSSAQGRGHIESLFRNEDGSDVTVRFVDKKRIRSWLNVNRLQLPLHSFNLDPNNSISNSGKNVNTQNNPISPKSTSGEAKVMADERVPAVRHSRKHDAHGNEYWNVDTDKDIFKSLTTVKQLQNAAYDFILNGEKGERVTDIIDGEELQFRRISAKEYVYGTASKKLGDTEYKQKMRLSPSVIDLIENATIKYDAPDFKTHKMFSEGFKNYQGRVGIDDTIFRYIVRVGKATDGKVFYDINLEVDVKVPSAEKHVSHVKMSTSDNSIRQESKNVNTQNNVRHSISHTRKGEPVVVVDTNILEGVDESQWKEKVKEAIKGFFPGLLFKGGEAEVKKKTYDEYLKSRYTNSIKKFERDVYEDKLRASNHLDEILLSITDTRTEDLFHDRSDKIKGFVHGDVKIVVGDNKYIADAVIGIKEDGSMLVYDVVDFMPAEFELEEQKEKATVRSSRSHTEKQNEENFKKAYDEWSVSGKPDRQTLTVGTVSYALTSIGVKEQTIKWDTSKINSSLKKHKYLKDDIVKQIPSLINNPILIMQSKSHDSRLTLFGEVYDGDGLPIMVVLELMPANRKNTVILDEIKVTSTHSRKDKNNPSSMLQTQNLINSSDIYYIEPNKNRTNNWLMLNRLQLPLSISNYGPIKMITYPSEKVKMQNVDINNSSRSSRSHINYADETDDGTRSMTSEEERSEAIKAVLGQFDRRERALDRWGMNIQGSSDSGTGMSLEAAVIKAKKSFGIPIVHGGNANVAGETASASYNKEAKTIRTKFKNDLPAIAHAIGYHIDEKLKLTDAILEQTGRVRQTNGDGIGKLESELIGLNPLSNDASYESLREGIAEFVRMYLTSKNLAMKAAPAFYSYFESQLKTDEELLEAVEESAKAINEYFNQAFSERASSAVMTGKDWEELNKPKGKEKAEILRREFVTRIFDKFYGIKVVLKDNGVFDLSSSEDAYVRATNSLLARARAAALLDNGFFDENGKRVGESFFDIIAPLGAESSDRYKAFGDYLVFTHALEWLEPYDVESAGLKTSKGNPISNAKRKIVFGDETLNDTERLRGLIQQIERENSDFKEIAKKVYEYQDNLMKYYLIPSGAVSKESAEKFKAQYPHYVPFNRFNSEYDRIMGRRTKNAFANLNNPVKTAEGGSATIRNPLESIINSTIMAVDFKMKNDVMMALVTQFTGANGIPGVMERIYSTSELEKISQEQNPFITEESISTLAANDGKGKAYNPAVSGKEGIVSVWVNGEKRFYQIYDSKFYNSIAKLGVEELNGFFRFMNSLSNVMKATMTQYNPLFGLGNAVRDFYNFHYQTSSNANLLRQIFMYYDAVKTMWNKEEDFQLYKALGGADSSRFRADMDTLQRAVRKRNIKHESFVKKLGYYKLGLSKMLDLYTGINEVIETAPRLAEFKYTRQTTGDIQLAMYRSQDVTTNFKRSGTWGKRINSVVLFSNASLQGVDKMIRNFTEAGYLEGSSFDKKKVAGKITKAVVFSIVMTALQEFWNRHDDEAEEEYERLSEYIKNNYDVFYVGDGKFVKLPKEQNNSIPRVIMQRLFDMSQGDEVNLRELGGYIWSQMMPGFIPNFISDDPSDWLHSILNSTPIGGIADVVYNRDYRGNEIVPTYMKGPDFKKYNDYTNWFAVKAAGLLYDVTGWDVSPMSIEHMIESYGNFYGTFTTSLHPYKETEEKVQNSGFISGTRSVGWKNVLSATGAGQKYVADARYSTDILNNFYDDAKKAENELSRRDTGENAASNEKYLKMKNFMSSFNKLSKTGSEQQQRLDRKMIQIMLEGFDGKELSAGEKYAARLYDNTGIDEVFKSTYPKPEFSETIKKGKKKHVYTVSLNSNLYAQFCSDIDDMRERTRVMIRDLGLEDKDAAFLLSKCYTAINDEVMSRYLTRYGESDSQLKYKQQKQKDEEKIIKEQKDKLKKLSDDAYEEELKRLIYGN